MGGAPKTPKWDPIGFDPQPCTKQTQVERRKPFFRDLHHGSAGLKPMVGQQVKYPLGLGTEGAASFRNVNCHGTKKACFWCFCCSRGNPSQTTFTSCEWVGNKHVETSSCCHKSRLPKTKSARFSFHCEQGQAQQPSQFEWGLHDRENERSLASTLPLPSVLAFLINLHLALDLALLAFHALDLPPQLLEPGHCPAEGQGLEPRMLALAAPPSAPQVTPGRRKGFLGPELCAACLRLGFLLAEAAPQKSAITADLDCPLLALLAEMHPWHVGCQALVDDTFLDAALRHQLCAEELGCCQGGGLRRCLVQAPVHEASDVEHFVVIFALYPPSDLPAKQRRFPGNATDAT